MAEPYVSMVLIYCFVCGCTLHSGRRSSEVHRPSVGQVGPVSARESYISAMLLWWDVPYIKNTTMK